MSREEDDAVALVRVYCGLASVDSAAAPASAGATLTAAVVDDAGRLLDVCEIGDDPAGYAKLGVLLAGRSSGSSGAVVAADSDDHLVTSLLTAAGRPLAIADDDSVDDYAERFADDDSPTEISSPAGTRRAVGLARALQAGAISATTLPAPRDLAAFKPALAAHLALASGRHSAAVALREVLRELYPAALRAYPDPAEPLSLAVLDALPEPGMLGGSGNRGRDTTVAAEAVAAHLAADGIADTETITNAVTALRLAIAETPARGTNTTAITSATAEAVRQAVAAVRACDAGCDALVATLSARITAPPSTAGRRTRRTASASSEAPTSAPPAAGPRPVHPAAERTPVGGRRNRLAPEAGTAPAAPRPLAPPPVAPDPVAPPPVAPRPAAPAAALTPTSAPPVSAPPVSGPPFPLAPAAQHRLDPPHNRPISAPPPPPPGMTPIVPAQRVASSEADTDNRSQRPSPPSEPSGPGRRAAAARTPEGLPRRGASPDADAPSRRPDVPAPSTPDRPARRGPVPPAEAGEPFRAPITAAAINSARAERQRPTPIVPRPNTRGEQPSAKAGFNATDFVVPLPASRPPAEETPAAEPGSRAAWPLVGPADESGEGTDRREPAYDLDSRDRSRGGPGEPTGETRVKPPWLADDLPPEPPSLRLVEPRPVVAPAARQEQPTGPAGTARPAPRPDKPRPDAPQPDPAPLRLVEPGSDRGPQPRQAGPERAAPPVVSSEGDNDLLIFAAASAWFSGQDEEGTELEWSSTADSGWRAAEQAAQPSVGVETAAGLPKRVPQANLVPGSPLREERPLRIVRDAARIAENTTGYFSGWRRGQEIGGYAVGGRPGREAAGGWDFSRDHGGREESDREYEYRSAGHRS
ncbi:transposase [Polymorphospora sp. NPDC050346]|uniref:transposase n=1 Tax=Polymorphospora sp. NPDC050346 TaxID=3155780 RepID=UPI0033C7DD00